MADRRLRLLIEILLKNERALQQLRKEFEGLSQSGQNIGDPLKKFNEEARRSGSTSKRSLADLAFAFNNITAATQTAIGFAQQFYSLTIGRSEELNQQLLQVQATLASTSRVFQGGIELQGIEAITATRGELEDALRELERRTENIAGLTSQQLNAAFTAILGNAAQLTDQSKEFASSIESATELTTALAPALTTIGLPQQQITQEVRAILQGNIDNNAVLARTLNITNEQVRQWRSQGVLVDNLIDRVKVFEQASNLAARSVSNIASNIQDIGERIGRNIGDQIQDPLVDALSGVEQNLRTNEQDIQEFLTFFAQGFATTADEISEELGPAAAELFALVESAAPLVQNLFILISNGLIGSAKLLGPLLTDLGRLINLTTEGLAALSELIQLRQINEGAEALDILADSSDALTEEVVKTAGALKSLSEVQEGQGVLTDSQRERLELLKDQQRSLVASIDEQISSLRSLNLAGEENNNARNAQVASLEALRRGLLASSGEIEIQARAIRDLGTSYEQLNERLNATADIIAQGGGGDELIFNNALKERVDILKQLNELGEINAFRAEQELRAIAQNEQAKSEIQQAAAQAITQIRKQELDNQLRDLDASISEIESLAATGEISQREAVEQTTEFRRQQLQIRIADVENAIRAEEQAIASGFGSQQRLTLLIAEERTLQADRERIAVEGERQIQDARIRVAEQASRRAADVARQAEADRQLEIQQLINQGLLNSEDAERQRLELTQDRIASELSAERAKLAELQQLALIGSEEERAQAEARLRQQSLRVRELEIDQLENARRQEEQFNRELITSIRNRSREEQRAQELRIFKLEQGQAIIESETNSIENQTRAIDAQSRSLDRQLRLIQSQADLQRTISEAEQSLGNLRVDRLNRALEIRRQLDSGEIESSRVRRQLERELRALTGRRNADEEDIIEARREQEEELAELQREAFERQLEQSRLSQQIELQQADIASRRALLEAQITAQKAKQSELQARINQQQTEQEVIAARAALEEAQATVRLDDTETNRQAVADAELALRRAEEALGPAQEQVELARESIRFSQQAVEEAEQQVLAQSRIAEASRRALDAQEDSQRALQLAREEAAQLASELERAQLAAEGISVSGINVGRVGQVRRLPGFAEGGVSPGGPIVVGEGGRPEVVITSPGDRVVSYQSAARTIQQSLTQNPELAQQFGFSPSSSTITTERMEGLLSTMQQQSQEANSLLGKIAALGGARQSPAKRAITPRPQSSDPLSGLYGTLF